MPTLCGTFSVRLLCHFMSGNGSLANIPQMTQRLRILCQHRSWVAIARSIVIWLCLGCLFIARNTVSGEPTIGLPFTKSYSLEEIGAFRGAHIEFDRLGRLAVISEHSYTVLNDNIGMDIAVPDPASSIMLKTVDEGRQKSYYGALASWGVVDYHEPRESAGASTSS